MPFLNGFDASIVVKENGEALPSYGIVIDQFTRSLTCWISCETHLRYKVAWNCLNHKMFSRGRIYINGEIIGNMTMRKDDSDGTLSKMRKNLENNRMFLKDSRGNRSTVEGEICLVIDRVELLNTQVESFKMIEHIVTFVFKYRTLEFLKSNGILDQATVTIPAIFPDLTPSADYQQVDVDMTDAQDEAVLDSKICEIQNQIIDLYAKKLSAERMRPSSRVRRPQNMSKEERKKAEKQRLEDELRMLPRRPPSERIRIRKHREEVGEDAPTGFLP